MIIAPALWNRWSTTQHYFSAPRYLLPAVSGYLLGKTLAEFLWKLNKLYEPTSSTSPQLCSISVLFTQFVMILDIIILHMMINKSFIVRQGTGKHWSDVRRELEKILYISTQAAISLKFYIIDTSFNMDIKSGNFLDISSEHTWNQALDLWLPIPWTLDVIICGEDEWSPTCCCSRAIKLDNEYRKPDIARNSIR